MFFNTSFFVYTIWIIRSLPLVFTSRLQTARKPIQWQELRKQTH